ncbi:MAG TPA: hypothetical protein VEL28_19955 [Candidatus Binatia bacterium]|nr:hypothetical protein [Candidatus Binatia bacterium]
MRRYAASMILVAGLAMAGCNNGAAELLATAQLEEKQDNLDHARQLYQQIVRDHATSAQADTARQRLAALQEGEVEGEAQ